LLSFTERAVRFWVHLYTAGLPSMVRDHRRAEIESDLWEEVADAANGRSEDPAVPALVLVRMLLGVPSDLAWRLEAAAESRAEKAPEAASWQLRLDRWGFFSVGVLLFLFSLVGSAGLWMGHPVTLSEMARSSAAALLMLNGLALAAGMSLIRRWPHAGAGLVVVGAVLFAMAWYWTIVGPLLSIGLAAFGIRTARRLLKERDGPHVL
jgi:hypothetical protein